MKKIFTLFACIAVFILSAIAQPNYLAGSSKFDGLSSQIPSGSNMILERRSVSGIAYKTVRANQSASDVWCKFVDGSQGWYYQWCFKDRATANFGQSYNADFSKNDGRDILVDIIADMYYTFVITTTESDSSNMFAIQQTSAAPTIFSISCSQPAVGEAVTVTAMLNQKLLMEEKIFMAYSADGGTYIKVPMSASGDGLSAQIPSSVNADGVSVKYFVYTTTVNDLNPNASDIDVLSLCQKGGSYKIDSDVPTPESPVIAAHRSYLNENDFTDFASLYVKSYGGLEAKEYVGEYKYKWSQSTDGGISWGDVTGVKKDNINNIRPIQAGLFRCTISRMYATTGTWVSVVSNVISVTNTNGDKRSITSNLPIIIVKTDVEDFPSGYNPLMEGNEMFRAFKAKRSVDVKIIWDETSKDDVSKTYTQDDRYDSSRLYYDKKARMNYRGSSSLDQERKNYAFVVGDDSCTVSGKWVKDKKKMFNLNKTKDKDFILYASAADGTMMRNKLGLELTEDVTGLWNSHGRYVRLFVNGEDKGIYIFMEKNKREDNRIQTESDGFVFKYDKTDIIDRFSSNDGAKSTFTTSRIGKTNISTYSLIVDQAFEVVYPEWDEDEFTMQQWNSIINSLRDRLQQLDDAFSQNDYVKVRQIIDYDSWADNFIMNEFIYNYDGYRISQFFYMPTASSKIKASPMWDLELGFGNRSSSYSGFLYQSGAAHEMSFPSPYWWDGSSTYYVSGDGLMGDKCFKAKIRQRWQRYVAAGGPLADAHVNELIDSYAVSLMTSAPSSLKGWISNRRDWLNNQIMGEISSFPNYISKVTMYDKSDVEFGSNVIMSAKVTGYDSEGYNFAWYFKGADSSEWTTLTTSGGADYMIDSATMDNSGQYKCIVTSRTCDCITDSATASLSVTGAVEVILVSEPEYGGTCTGAGLYKSGSNVTISANPENGYRFVKWSDEDTKNPRTLLNVMESTELWAIFDIVSTVEPNDSSPIEVFVSDRTIHVIAPDAKSISFKNVVGQVYAVNVYEFRVPTSGIWIVIVDDKTVKVVIR